METLKAFVLVLICACCVCSAEAAGLAVKRGQERVDGSKLPLVCIVFGTDGISMPIHSVTVIDLLDSKKRTFVVSKSFRNNHPDYLTALSGETMLCLLTLSLPVGEYQLDSVQYLGGRNDDFDYTFSFSKYKKLRFAVAPDVVNFVGSVEFAAPWSPMRYPDSVTQTALHPLVIRKQLSTTITVRDSATRDCKWVYDQIPGLREFKVSFSHLDDIAADTKQAEPGATDNPDDAQRSREDH